jgi:hypothetical protein
VLPLPQIRYDTITISRDTEGNNAIQLGASQRHIRLTLQQHPISDDKLHSGKRQMTRYELTLLGYEKTPDDLTCRAGSWAREAPVADALLMKAIDLPGKLQAVYREDDNYPGWTLKLAGDKQVIFHSYRRQPGSGRLLQVLYSVPQDNAARILGYRLGTPLPDKRPPSPDWLKALQQAIASNKPGHWKTFFQLAEQSGFDPEQLQQSKTQLGL